MFQRQWPFPWSNPLNHKLDLCRPYLTNVLSKYVYPEFDYKVHTNNMQWSNSDLDLSDPKSNPNIICCIYVHTNIGFTMSFLTKESRYLVETKSSLSLLIADPWHNWTQKQFCHCILSRNYPHTNLALSSIKSWHGFQFDRVIGKELRGLRKQC